MEILFLRKVEMYIPMYFKFGQVHVGPVAPAALIAEYLALF